MEPELISVIVPVYNGAAYLPRCLEAITAQTYMNLEIILVDDGSTDESGRLCEEFAARDARARVIHQLNAGLWAARNTGQDAARGEYLFFPDADDYFHRDTIRLMYEALQRHPVCDFAMVGRKMTERPDEDVDTPVAPLEREVSTEEMMTGMFGAEERKNDRFYVYMWNKLFRRSLIEDIHSRRYLRSQDMDFNIRAFLKARRAVILDHDLYYWLQHPGSLTKASEAWDIYYECRSDICYRNFMELPAARPFAHFLLGRLYKLMVFWKNRNYRKETQAAVFSACRRYERDTRRAYLRERRIPFREKLLTLTLLHAPWLARRAMKATKNY